MSLGRRYYKFLISLLPNSFKRNRGSDLLMVFDDMRAELGPNPSIARKAKLYARLTFDLLKQIPSERTRSGRRQCYLSQQSGESIDPRQPCIGLRFESLVRDVRSAARSLGRRPIFLSVATLSLALGIGANTTIFSVVNAFFFKQYDYRAPEKLV